MDAKELAISLRQFTGTEQWYMAALNKDCLYTDGVQYFAEHAGTYWLLDILATELFELQQQRGFLLVKLVVGDEHKAKIISEDGDYHELWSKDIDYTDCPLGTWKFFFTDNIILLPSEY
jgi:hypothetical protein